MLILLNFDRDFVQNVPTSVGRERENVTALKVDLQDEPHWVRWGEICKGVPEAQGSLTVPHLTVRREKPFLAGKTRRVGVAEGGRGKQKTKSKQSGSYGESSHIIQLLLMLNFKKMKTKHITVFNIYFFNITNILINTGT